MTEHDGVDGPDERFGRLQPEAPQLWGFDPLNGAPILSDNLDVWSMVDMPELDGAGRTDVPVSYTAQPQVVGYSMGGAEGAGEFRSCGRWTHWWGWTLFVIGAVALGIALAVA